MFIIKLMSLADRLKTCFNRIYIPWHYTSYSKCFSLKEYSMMWFRVYRPVINPKVLQLG